MDNDAVTPARIATAIQAVFNYYPTHWLDIFKIAAFIGRWEIHLSPDRIKQELRVLYRAKTIAFREHNGTQQWRANKGAIR